MLLGFIIILLMAAMLTVVILLYRGFVKNKKEMEVSNKILLSYENGEAYSDKQIENMEKVINNRIEEYETQFLQGVKDGSIPVPRQITDAISVKSAEYEIQIAELIKENKALSESEAASKLAVERHLQTIAVLQKKLTGEPQIPEHVKEMENAEGTEKEEAGPELSEHGPLEAEYQEEAPGETTVSPLANDELKDEQEYL